MATGGSTWGQPTPASFYLPERAGPSPSPMLARVSIVLAEKKFRAYVCLLAMYLVLRRGMSAYLWVLTYLGTVPHDA